ncbi:hypothetical protein PanWU01x14_319440, partial [Parasponia andersonii]
AAASKWYLNRVKNEKREFGISDHLLPSFLPVAATKFLSLSFPEPEQNIFALQSNQTDKDH